MTPEAPNDPTSSLVGAVQGDARAAERLVPLLYDKLRRLAAKYLAEERPNHTLQPTALVNEAYLGLIDINRVDWAGKTHFFAMAARQMRRVLKDHARAKNAKKRGQRPQQVSLNEDLAIAAGPSVELLALDQAIEGLARTYSRQSQVAELRLFAGMKITEIAHSLGVSRRTAQGDWELARVWLARKLRSEAQNE